MPQPVTDEWGVATESMHSCLPHCDRTAPAAAAVLSIRLLHEAQASQVKAGCSLPRR
jgi:hypothetical protein